MSREECDYAMQICVPTELKKKLFLLLYKAKPEYNLLKNS